MKTTEKIDIAMPLSPQISQEHGEDHAIMPGEFAGMYQTGFEAGYKRGRDAGYQQGLGESIAAIQHGPSNKAVTKAAVESETALKVGSRRMLLGMPCKRCRIYLYSGETQCPGCKQPAKVAS